MSWKTEDRLEGDLIRHYVIGDYTVREWLKDTINYDVSYGGNLTINGVYYDINNLRVYIPDDINLDARIKRFDDGYYGTPGIITE